MGIQELMKGNTKEMEPTVSGEQPVVRVRLFGAFELERLEAPSSREDIWKGRTSARALLKFLLCLPGRQASRSVLAGTFWPERDEERARESLRAACSVLRKVIRAADGIDLLEQRSNGNILKLADQSRLWVDADAFEDLVSQASRLRDPESALPLWEEAHALLRGELLADDQQTEWISHPAVKRRRQALGLARSRLVRCLTDLYVQRGQRTLAEELLEAHVVRFPADQDALYRLLLLLEEQGCLEQASLLYERARRMLEAHGKQPAHHVRLLYDRFQHTFTSGAPMYSTQTERPAPETAVEVARDTSSALLREGLQGPEREWIGTTSHVLTVLGTDGRLDTSLHVLQTLLEGEEGASNMPQLSRRHLLELSIAALISRLAQLDKQRITGVDRDELAWALEKGIADGWKLFSTAANAEVLAVSQLQLALIHQAHPLLHPSTRSYLYAGAYGLVGLALHHQGRYEEALHAYHNAHLAALATRDPWHIAQNLICQADMYHTLGRDTEALHMIEEALLGLGEIDEAHRRARAHLLGCWANIAMTMGDFETARQKLDAIAVLLDQISSNLVEEFDRLSLYELTGKYAYLTGNYPTAAQWYEQALRELPTEWILRQTLVLMPLISTYIALRDHDASISTVEKATQVVPVLNAPVMNKAVNDALEGLLIVFPHEAQVKTVVADLLQQLHSKRQKNIQQKRG